MLKALEYLDKNKYFILIFGKMWNFEKLIKTNFEFKYLGYISKKEQLRNIYNSGDVFVIPSIQDAFPKTFIEAMLCGLPVVAFKNTSISHVNIHKKTGYNAKFNNSKDFSNGIEYVIDNKKLKKNARNQVLKNFNPDQVTEKYIKLYHELLNG